MGYERSFGGFFSELFTNASEESGPSDTRKLLMLAQQMAYSSGKDVCTKLAVSGEDEDTPIITVECNEVIENQDSQSFAKIKISSSDYSNMFPKKSTDRIEDTTTFNFRGIPHFEKAKQFFEDGSLAEEKELLPWYNQAGEFHFDTFKSLTLHIITYLAQNPRATLEKIHNMIIVMPKQTVAAVVRSLVKCQILIEYAPTLSMALKSPFQSKNFWTRKLDAVSCATYSINIL